MDEAVGPRATGTARQPRNGAGSEQGAAARTRPRRRLRLTPKARCKGEPA